MARLRFMFVFSVVCCLALSRESLIGTSMATQIAENLLSVEGARPIAKAMVMLESRYAQPITYEEGPYAYTGDVEDVTVAENAPRRILAPRRWRIDAKMLLPENATKADLIGLVNSFLHTAAQDRGMSESFRVLQSSYGLHVVPTKVRNREGQETAVMPVLDVRLTVPRQSGDQYSLLQSLCHEVSQATGVDVILATIPPDFIKRTATIGAENDPARDVLIRVLKEDGRGLSWHLLHGPTTGAFYLNIGPPGRLMPIK